VSEYATVAQAARCPGSSPPSLRPPPPLASFEALRRRRKQLCQARLGGECSSNAEPSLEEIGSYLAPNRASYF